MQSFDTPTKGLSGKPGELRLQPHARRSGVFSIAPDIAFLPALADALVTGKLFEHFRPAEDPLKLADATIYVPNRRTARALSLAFVDQFPEQAVLLPAIRTLGDVDDEEFGLNPGLGDEISLPPAVGAVERKLQLAALVQKWVDNLSEETRRLYGEEDIFIPSSQADAIRLSDDLCRLLDQLNREEKTWQEVDAIVPEEHAQWWNLTSAFLKIIVEFWPAVLAERGQMDPASRSAVLLERRVQQYRQNGSSGPVVIAGTTGSVPSTQRLLKAVANLENGAVVLPGLDLDMQPEQWLALGERENQQGTESHPQHGLFRLLAALGMDRESVVSIGSSQPAAGLRRKFVSTALALPQFTPEWRAQIASTGQSELEDAFAQVSVIEAGNERQEALAIATCLREALTEPNRTAALVTPDRNMARRVAIELQRFGISVDDSAGRPFSGSPCGRHLRLMARICFGPDTNTNLAQFLKSSMTICGTTRENARTLAQEIEKRFLRGAITRARAGRLAEWLAAECERRGIDPGDASTLVEHAERIDAAIASLAALKERTVSVPVREYLDCLAHCAELVSMDDDGQAMIGQFEGHAEFIKLLEQVQISRGPDFMVLPLDFPAVFDALVAPLTLRTTSATHPRLHIYGPLEIRLQNHDRVIMAGLNEGTWPSSASNDPFLNRMMRVEIGIPSPERGTGLAAHDFQQMMGKREIILSRSTRVDRAPAIASRWLQRLTALLPEKISSDMRERGNRYITLAEQLEQGETPAKRTERPCPVPPVYARPNDLPVTDIETWIRDPYALYAKRILKLRKLDPLEREPDAMLRGTLYHAVMEQYVSLDRLRLPDETRQEQLMAIARQQMTSEGLPEDVALLWTLQFEELVESLVRWENEYWEDFVPVGIAKEISGQMQLANGSFNLRARADRIDHLGDGSIFIMDYKTGKSPSLNQARTLLAPQLALEGAIAQSGGFASIPAASGIRLGFLRLLGGDDLGLQALEGKDVVVEDLIAQVVGKLEAQIAAFQAPGQGYISRRAPFKEGQFGSDYDHLARVREWSFGSGEDDDAED